METRAERRRRMRQMRDEFVTRYKFIEACGCGLDVEAEDQDQAFAAMVKDYVAHSHNNGKSVVKLRVQERPGIQIGTVEMDFDQGTATFSHGGPPFPCGTGYDQVCYGCGSRYHYESQPIAHPELWQEDGGDDVQICDDCWQKLQEKIRT